MPRFLSPLVLVAGLGILAACSAPPPPSPAASPTPATPAAAAAPVTSPLEPRYAATEAEGINFATPGYPEFVSEVKGISGPEAWGRWTDGALAPVTSIKLEKPISGNASIHLKVRDFFGINAKQKIAVRFGGQEKSFELKGDADQEVEVEFESLENASTIEIVVPNKSPPTETDTREMGLGLISLSIKQ